MASLAQFGFSDLEASYAFGMVFREGRTVDSCVNDAANVLIGLTDEDRAAIASGTIAAPRQPPPPPAVADGPLIDGEECKLMLCVRSDLGMSVGKMCAQCGHAVQGALRSIEREMRGPHGDRYASWMSCWEMESGSAKIAVRVGSEAEMDAIVRQCRESSRGGAPIPVHVVRDAGRTEIAAGSKTVVAVGPAPKSLINDVTGKMDLL